MSGKKVRISAKIKIIISLLTITTIFSGYTQSQKNKTYTSDNNMITDNHSKGQVLSPRQIPKKYHVFLSKEIKNISDIMKFIKKQKSRQ